MLGKCVLGAAILLAMAGSATAGGAYAPASGAGLRAGLDSDIGVRTWLGFGSAGESLYDPTTGGLVSRLTYDGMPIASGEVFGNAHAGGFFVSGFAGLGVLPDGNLQDEDFPPYLSAYSSTNSNQRSGSLKYATIDVGHDLVDWGGVRAGAFVGYNYVDQQMNALGCTQTGGNPAVCVPSIDGSVSVISQANAWQSLRLGFNATARLDNGFSVNGDIAALPYVSLSGADTHWLRIPADFTGPIPEDGTGWGLQVQAMLDYQVNDRLSLGIGGRYWHMQTVGTAHFENHLTAGGGQPQPDHWFTDMGGLLAEAKAHF